MTEPTHNPAKAIRRTAFACLALVVGMTGLAYASVPLYDLFCRVTGFGGTPRIATSSPGITTNRVITVRFDANVSPSLNWRFTPEVPTVDVKVGETKTLFYKVTNTGKTAATGIASFNVEPETAAAYFTKIQCFCFTEHTLQPGETMESPVVFYIDPAIEADPEAKDLAMITLSYTYFPSKAPKPVADAADRAAKPQL